jgi:hypothetical protein
MRFFNLLNIQHFVLAVFPALLGVVLVCIALSFSHFRGKDSEERRSRVIRTYPGGIEERRAPFPLFLFLVILGTVLWGIGYILMVSLTGEVI